MTDKYGVLTQEQWAEIGLIAFKFVDRAGDPHPGIDGAEDICAEFYMAITQYTDPIFYNAFNKSQQDTDAAVCYTTHNNSYTRMTHKLDSLAALYSQGNTPVRELIAAALTDPDLDYWVDQYKDGWIGNNGKFARTMARVLQTI